MSFSGRSVIVTAGASGIGHAIATSFHRNGDAVHVVDIDAGAAARFSSDYPGIKTTVADVASESDVSRVMDTHIEQFHGVDVMVNCAGIAGPTEFVENISFEQWQRCFAVNIDAVFLFCNQVVPFMKAARAGNIINISSTAGWHGYPLRTPYAASKWAVIGLTKSLAMELGGLGIRANVICPGSINGERMDRIISAEASLTGVSEQVVRDGYTRSCSMRTFIDAQDIADMALFLCSDNAGKVTGQIMNVDGHLESFQGLENLSTPNQTTGESGNEL